MVEPGEETPRLFGDKVGVDPKKRPAYAENPLVPKDRRWKHPQRQSLETKAISSSVHLRFPVEPLPDGKTPFLPDGTYFATINDRGSNPTVQLFRLTEDVGIKVANYEELHKLVEEDYQHKQPIRSGRHTFNPRLFLVKIPVVPIEVETLELEDFEKLWKNPMYSSRAKVRAGRTDKRGTYMTSRPDEEDIKRGYRKVWTKLAFVTTESLPEEPVSALF